MGSTRPAQFSEEDLAFLKTLGTQVVISVAKARLSEVADRLRQENLELRRAVEGKYTFGEIRLQHSGNADLTTEGSRRIWP